jgi:hypothetical protein
MPGFLSLQKLVQMKNTSKIVVALAVVGVAAIVVTVARKVNTRRILTKISDEGYETAQDILYPDRNDQGSQLRYGPVLPAL